MKKIKVCVALLLATVATVSAQNGGEILDKIQKANESLTSIVCDFRQTTHFPFLEEDAQSNGKLYYRTPARLLLEYEQPEGDWILVREDQISISMMDQYRKISAKTVPAAKFLHTIFASCLEGNPRRIDGITISAYERADYYEVLVSIGSEKAENIKELKVRYDKKDMAMSMLCMEDPDGEYTLYELRGKKLNQPVADDIFIDPGR